MKKLLWISASLVALVLGQSAFANEWYCGERMDKMVNEFKLDKDQKEKIKPIMDQLKASMKENASQMKDLSKQLNEKVMSSSDDQAGMDSLVDKKTQMIGNMMKAKMNAKHQVYMVLKPEQQKRYQDMMKKMEEKFTEKYKQCKGDGE